MIELALFGDQGKRIETVEWGLRQRVGNYLMDKGQVEIRPSEENARQNVGMQQYGWRDTEVVQRTVVTYTSDWEPA